MLICGGMKNIENKENRENKTNREKKENRTNRSIRKTDLILISVLLVVALIAGGIWMLTRQTGGTAVVSVNGEDIQRLPLNINTEVYIGDEENYNIVVIENGSAYVKEASCPDKVCVNTGKIKYTGETIVCLPNKTVVRVEDAPDTDLDEIAQ